MSYVDPINSISGLSRYDYVLPKELIATSPADPKDSSRLLVYDTKSDEVTFDTFLNVDKYLPQKSLLVLNDTKVVPAKVLLTKSTGGKVNALLLANEVENGEIKALVDRKVTVGDKLNISPEFSFKVIRQEQKIFFLKPNFKISKLHEVLSVYGKTPLPKYIKSSDSEEKLRKIYQSVFAQKPASVAAPTASFHFTKRVLQKLATKGIETAFVTLHVGLGTFSPLTNENFEREALHKEYFIVPDETRKKIQNAKNEGKPVIAVGTTSVRSLESHNDNDFTQLFIKPGFNFKVVDSMITNFHLPQSSLMLLVEAFLQHKHAKKTILDLYQIALAQKMRFYSFGDAMLIL